MAAENGFSGDGFIMLAERFRAFAARLSTVGETGALVVTDKMHTEVDALYGPKLGKHWIIESGKTSDAVASVTVRTDDVRVLGYEFGTRPHRIPRDGYAKPMLRFDGKGGLIYTPYVNHPGTHAHDKRFELKDALQRHARATWSQAITSALQNF